MSAIEERGGERSAVPEDGGLASEAAAGDGNVGCRGTDRRGERREASEDWDRKERGAGGDVWNTGGIDEGTVENAEFAWA